MINIISPINQLGYGITGLNITKSLNKSKDISLWCIGQPQVTNEEDADIISKALTNARYPDFNAPCIRIWHQHDMSQFVGRGTKIGFPIFELDTFSKLEQHHLSSLDKIFVCSNWAKRVVENNIKDIEVCVIPLGVDTSIFKPLPEDELESSGRHQSTIFFNCGKWEVRKGHDILVHIFEEAFNEQDNVELWLMCDNPFLSREETNKWHSKYVHSKLGTKIKIIPRVQTQLEVYSIMKQVDCGIFPSRAEGWNLELLELMSCGKNVISTNYSAHTDFCNQDNCYLVDIEETELAYDDKWFKGNVGNWAKISNKQISQFAEYMRNVHSMKQNQDLPRNTNGISTADQFSWENTAEAIISNV